MFWVWSFIATIGGVLTLWGYKSLPKGTNMMPIPVKKRIRKGPYRWLAHPMYIGELIMLTGLGGMAAGFWNAFALFTIGELLISYWIGLEEQV